MFQFLNPIWLFTAAAIIVPVVIHLWNIRPGKVLKVGSTSLITAASRKSSRSFKLLDILLLLLRCLFLILLAVFLAMPVLEQRIKVQKAKGWVLLPKENFSAGYSRYKKQIDSLTRLGYEFHYFNTGLPKANLAKLLLENKNIKSIDTTLNNTSVYWILLSQVDKQVPADMPVYLYTTNTLNHFNGSKAQVNLNLHWQTFNTADSVNTWVQDAWFTNNNSIRVVKGTSTAAGTAYSYYNIQSDKGNSDFAVNVNNGQATVMLKGSKEAAVVVDTATLKIAVYTDHNSADAGYLKAALDAVAQFTQRKVYIKQYSAVNAIPANQTWVFWLSEQAVPARLLQSASNIFAYKAGKQANVNTSITERNNLGVPNGLAQVALFKEVNAGSIKGNVIWRDGFGKPVLAETRQGKARMYAFLSRFNPTWNDLVWNSSFPRLMLGLITAVPKTPPAAYDLRTMSPEQMQPLKTTDTHVIADKFTIEKDLAKYFWLGLIVVFFIERWLSTRNKMVQSNG